MSRLTESAYWVWARERIQGEIGTEGETAEIPMKPWELLVFQGLLGMEEAGRPLEGPTMTLLCGKCGEFSDIPHLLVHYALDCICPSCGEDFPALAPGEEFESTIAHEVGEGRQARSHLDLSGDTSDTAGTADTGDTLQLGREEAKRIGPYTVRALLGQGGSGSVFLVEDAEGTESALKVVTNQDKRFEREIAVLRKVEDPHLVGYRDEGVDAEGHPYVVMEYLPGADLRRLVALREHERLSLGEALFVLSACAGGLAALHAADVVHRDIKPSNLLATINGRVVLTDCGIALAGDVTQRLTAQNRVLGTPQYVAPELLTDAEPTPAADVFSLGAMIWRLLTGKRPFPGKRIVDVLQARLTQTPAPIDETCHDAPVWLVKLVQRMLDRDPEGRPSVGEIRKLVDGSELLPTQEAMATRWREELQELSLERGSLAQDTRVQSGDQFLNYHIEKELGRGGMGVVYQAFHQGLRKRVALKMLLQGALASDRERQRFLREAEAVAGLEHPAIVPVLDAGEREGTYFLVMDFVEGQTLGEWYPDQPREATLAAFMEVCEGVHHAHTRGVIHRDLKPDNVMIDTAGHAHVLDFGIAKTGAEDESASLTQDGSILGTLRYMAPEQARGATKEVDTRSDVYALGSVLYELLAGRTPFRGSLHELLHRVVHEDPPPPTHWVKELPWELEAICLKALEKDRDRRYQSALELRRDLERYLGGLPIQARRTTLLYRARKWVGRNRLKTVLAAATFLLTCAGAWALHYQSQRAEADRRAAIVLKVEDAAAHYAEARFELAARDFGIAAETLRTSDNFPLTAAVTRTLPCAILDALPADERSQPRLQRARLQRWSDRALREAELQKTDALFSQAASALEAGELNEALIQLRVVTAGAPGDPRLAPLRQRLAQVLFERGREALAKERELSAAGASLSERRAVLTEAERVLSSADRLEQPEAGAALAVFHERAAAIRAAEESRDARREARARLEKAQALRAEAAKAKEPAVARTGLYAARRELTVARDRWSEVPGGREEQVRVALALGSLAIASGRVELAKVEYDNARLYEGILTKEVEALGAELAARDERERDYLKQRKAAEGHFGVGRYSQAVHAYELAIAALPEGDPRREVSKRRRTLAATYVSLERARRRADLDDERRLLQSAIQLADEPRDLQERLAEVDQELHQRELLRGHRLARGAHARTETWQAAIKAYESALRYDPRSPEALRGRADAFAERDCPQDMVLVSIPLRLLAKGSDAARVGEFEVLRYYLDRHEVTNADYQEFLQSKAYAAISWPQGAQPERFVDSTGQPGPRDWSEGGPPAGAEALPVAGISAYEAEAYAAWRKRRLPTDREWLLAACFDPATGRHRRFPWGAELAVGEREALRSLSPVGSRELDRSPWDIRDLGFNVSEWVRLGEEFGVRGLSTRFLSPDLARGARDWSKSPLPSYRHSSLGFRCARSVPEPPPLPKIPAEAERQK